MDKTKVPAATDAATEQDVRQYLDTEVEQPRQTPQPEPAAPDSS
jgi:hypothetical protein